MSRGKEREYIPRRIGKDGSMEDSRKVKPSKVKKEAPIQIYCFDR